MEIDVAGKATNLSGLKEHNYQLEAIPHVFKTLYSSMYENKEQVVLSELAANGLDAQVQNGTEDIPIKIVLPTPLSPELVVTDCGIGMSREVLEQLYTVYGASTKRGDNTGIGGFGFGSKSPFSLADSFTVVSTHEGITTHVANYLDNGMPKFVVVSSQHTGEPSGTTVSVPITDSRSQDQLRYIAEYLYACWDVRPEISGCEVLPARLAAAAPLYRADTYTVLNPGSPDQRFGRYFFHNQIPLEVVQVGPFIYNIPNEIKNYWSNSPTPDSEEDFDFLQKLTSELQGRLCLRFNIGELELSPTRERIEDTQENRDALLKHIKELRTYAQSVVPAWESADIADWLQHAVDHIHYDKNGTFLYFDKEAVPAYFNEKCGVAVEDPVISGWLAGRESAKYVFSESEARSLWDKIKHINPSNQQEFESEWYKNTNFLYDASDTPTACFRATGFELTPFRTYNQQRYLSGEEYAIEQILERHPVRYRVKKVTANNITYPVQGSLRIKTLMSADVLAVTPERLWPLFGRCVQAQPPAEGEVLYVVDSPNLDIAFEEIAKVKKDFVWLSLEETEKQYKATYSVVRLAKTAKAARRISEDLSTRVLGEVYSFKLTSCGSPYRIPGSFYGANYQKKYDEKLLVAFTSERHSPENAVDFLKYFPMLAGQVLVIAISSQESKTKRFTAWSESFEEVKLLEGDSQHFVRWRIQETKVFKEATKGAYEYLLALRRLTGNTGVYTNTHFAALEHLLGKKSPLARHVLMVLKPTNRLPSAKSLQVLPLNLRLLLYGIAANVDDSVFCEDDFTPESLDKLLLQKDFATLRNFAYQTGPFRPKETEAAA